MFKNRYKTLAVISAFSLGFSAATALAQEMPMKQDSGKMSPAAGIKNQETDMTDHGTDMIEVDSGKMKMGSGNTSSMIKPRMQGGSAPADARDPNANSGGYEYRGMAGFEETDMMTVSKVIADQFEYRNSNGTDVLKWDMQGWSGTDYKKLWVKFEGEDELSSNAGKMELQGLYSRTVSSFWDFQIGARYDTSYGTNSPDDRVFAVIGLQGLAPYWFEMEPAVFVSDNGDVSARLVASYDMLLTQRLILQPRFEMNVAASEVPEYGLGKGVNDVQLDLRLRYEIRRKFAPYVGLAWSQKFGATANMARADSGKTNTLSLVAGLRFWF